MAKRTTADLNGADREAILVEMGNYIDVEQPVSGRHPAGNSVDSIVAQKRMSAEADVIYHQDYGDEALAGDLAKLAAKDDAERAYRKATNGIADPPALTRLDALLDEPDEGKRFRVDRLLARGTSIMLVAQAKLGKTTLITNLVRSLVDSVPFLGEFAVDALDPERSVVILDCEMDRRQVRHALAELKIKNTDQVHVVTLAGALSSFDITDPPVRAEWAARLRAVDAQVLVLDCLRPVLDAIGLDENSEAGKFLTALDEFKRQAGIEELILVHHAGHATERQRGSSRLIDWPAVTWKLMADDVFAPRFFNAYGRDGVSFGGSQGQQLAFEATSGELSVVHGGLSRTETSTQSRAMRVYDAVAKADGRIETKSALLAALGTRSPRSQDWDSAIAHAASHGWIVTVSGQGRTGKATAFETGPANPHGGVRKISSLPRQYETDSDG